MSFSAEAWVLLGEWPANFMPKLDASITTYDDKRHLCCELVKAAARA